MKPGSAAAERTERVYQELAAARVALTYRELADRAGLTFLMTRAAVEMLKREGSIEPAIILRGSIFSDLHGFRWRQARPNGR